jgi:hypothetical protein
MKKLIAALVAGLFAAVTFTVLADDKVKSGNDLAKPGRAIDEGKGTVKSGADMAKPGRAADEGTAAPKKSKKKKKKDAQ